MRSRLIQKARRREFEGDRMEGGRARTRVSLGHFSKRYPEMLSGSQGRNR